MGYYKFKLPKGSAYYYHSTKTSEKVEKDYYTIVEYNHDSTIREVLEKVSTQFAQRIAIEEMHNVKNWVNIVLDTDTFVPIGDVKKGDKS